MPTPSKPSRLFSFRIPQEELDRARRVAESHGVTLTELIRIRLRELPVPDRAGRQERFELVQALTREMQYIGHNINQATAALHRAVRRNRPMGAELGRFTTQMEAYMGSRERLRACLEKFLEP